MWHELTDNIVLHPFGFFSSVCTGVKDFFLAAFHVNNSSTFIVTNVMLLPVDYFTPNCITPDFITLFTCFDCVTGPLHYVFPGACQ